MTMERMDTASPTATTLRIVLLVLAAAGLIIGSLLSWLSFGADIEALLGGQVPKTAGTNAPISIFWTAEGATDTTFFTSAGFVTIVLGVLALIGIVVPWLARLAGSLGIIAFVLYVVTLYRSEDLGPLSLGLGNVGIGMWVVLIGSVLALVAGFLTGRRTVVETTTAPPPMEP